MLAAAQLSKIKWPEHLFFGGYPLAERKVLAVYGDEPPAEEAFPLCCLRVSCRGGALTHRDYLGALLADVYKRQGFDNYERFEEEEAPPALMERLRALDVETLTPLEALNTLYELKQQLP